MKETTKKIVQKIAVAVMVVAAAAVGILCWLGGVFTRKKGGDQA